MSQLSSLDNGVVVELRTNSGHGTLQEDLSNDVFVEERLENQNLQPLACFLWRFKTHICVMKCTLYLRLQPDSV